MTGGVNYDGYNNKLDSTEVLRPGSEWQEITKARLPRPMYGVRVITVDIRVLLFGEWKQILIYLKPKFKSPVPSPRPAQPKIKVKA